MDAEEAPGVAVRELDGRVQGRHFRRHERRVGAGLDDEVLKFDALCSSEESAIGFSPTLNENQKNRHEGEAITFMTM